MASKRKLIRDDILTALRGIDAGAGYNHTVKFVSDKHEQLGKLRQDQFPAVFVTYGGPETSEFATVDGSYIDATVRFMLFCYLKVERGRSEMDEADDLIEDIKKALYADIFRGGSAESTLIETVTVDSVSEFPYVSIDMGVKCQYSHVNTTP